MSKYIVGWEGNMHVKDVPPRKTIMSDKPVYGWPGGSGAGGWFPGKRGILEEHNLSAWHGSYEGRHVYARHLPEHAEEPLAAFDAEIKELEAKLQAARTFRQELLIASAQLGARIKVLEAVEIKCTCPTNREKHAALAASPTCPLHKHLCNEGRAT